MIPSVTSAPIYIPPTPVIGTTVPDSTVTHLPPDNVPPSFSSVQVNNNARGNSTPTPQDEITPDEVAAQSDAAPIVSSQSLTQPGGQVASAQATFLTQLVAQDDPQSQTILVQYEKLVAYSNVKYKPSNALGPQIAPASLFSNIIHEPVAAHAVEATPAPSAPEPAPGPEEPTAATPPPAAEVQASEAAPAPSNDNKSAPVSSGIAAYTASITRIYSPVLNITDLA